MHNAPLTLVDRWSFGMLLYEMVTLGRYFPILNIPPRKAIWCMKLFGKVIEF